MARKNETTEDLRRQLEEAQKQWIVAENRVRRLQNRMQYSRKAKDRRRTHRLIQYGVAFEWNEPRLAELTDVEVFTFVEGLLALPEVQEQIWQAIIRHERDHASNASPIDAVSALAESPFNQMGGD